MARIKVDREKCVGCGSCVAIAPEIFDLDDEGKCYVKNQEGEGNLDEAIKACPVGAISKEG